MENNSSKLTFFKHGKYEYQTIVLEYQSNSGGWKYVSMVVDNSLDKAGAVKDFWERFGEIGNYEYNGKQITDVNEVEEKTV